MAMPEGESLEAFRARLDGAAIATYVAAMLVVPAKIWCRTRNGGFSGLAWDDTLCIVTLVLANGLFYTCMLGLRPSLGKHAILEVPVDEVEFFLRNLYAVGLNYISVISFIKYTILVFYWKLFSITARIPILAIASSVVMWHIAYTCLGAFSCDPIRSQFDLSVTDPRCLPSKTIYLSGSLINVIVDFVLVVMPMPYVWKLRAPIGQRLILASMFGLGFFVCIVSVIRLTEVMSIPEGDMDATFNLTDFILWSIVEVHVGLICSCLPSLRRLLSVVGLGRLFSRGSSADKNTGQTPNETPAARNTQPSSGGWSGSGSRSKLKGVGFWANMGLTKIDSEEDAYQMIDHSANPRGQSQAEVETGTGARSSHDTDEGRSPSGGKGPVNAAGIVVQRDWSVSVNENKRT